MKAAAPKESTVPNAMKAAATPRKRKSEAQVEPPSGKTRRLGRRDTLEQAERAKNTKLQHVDPLVIKTRVDANGQKMMSRICAEIRRIRPTNGYLSVKFWKALYRDYGLRASGFPTMPEYTEEDLIRDEFVDNLEPCLRKSKTERNIEPMRNIETGKTAKTDIDATRDAKMMRLFTRGIA